MTQRTYMTVSGVIFGIIALLHGARLLQGWPAQIGSVELPLWLSILGFLVAVYLAWSAWKLTAKS